MLNSVFFNLFQVCLTRCVNIQELQFISYNKNHVTFAVRIVMCLQDHVILSAPGFKEFSDMCIYFRLCFLIYAFFFFKQIEN